MNKYARGRDKMTTLKKNVTLIIIFVTSLFVTPLYVNSAIAPSLTDGLVGYWSCNEGSGSTVSDGSGNGNDGTISGAGWTSGLSGYCLDYDGINDYVSVVDGSDVRPTDLTMSAWVNFDLIPSDAVAIMAKSVGDETFNSYVIFWVNGKFVGQVSNGTSWSPVVQYTITPSWNVVSCSV